MTTVTERCWSITDPYLELNLFSILSRHIFRKGRGQWIVATRRPVQSCLIGQSPIRQRCLSQIDASQHVAPSLTLSPPGSFCRACRQKCISLKRSHSGRYCRLECCFAELIAPNPRPGLLSAKNSQYSPQKTEDNSVGVCHRKDTPAKRIWIR
jgi:hypothetical protein